MPPCIRPSILRSTAFCILCIERSKYQFSDPSRKSIHRLFPKIHSSIHSSNLRTFQKINSSKHFLRTSIHQSFQKILPIHRSFQTIRSSIHPTNCSSIHLGPSIQKTIHRSIQKTHSSIHTDDSFILIMIRPTRLPIQSTYEPSAFQRQITLEESTDTKVELNNIIFYNTKKCNDIRSFLLNL